MAESDSPRGEPLEHASEAGYRNFFEAIDSGFCIIELMFGEDGRANDYRFIKTNPTFESQSGLVDAVGRCISEFAPDLEEHWFDRYGQVALTGEPMRIEGEVAPLGRWFDINAFRVGNPEQRRIAVLFTDISARRNAEVALRESEHELQRMADSLPVLVSYVDRDQTYRFVNRAYENWFGWSPDELIGRSVREVIGEAAYAVAKPNIESALAGQTLSFEQELPYRVGGTRWIHVDFVPRRNTAGAVQGYYAVVQDISDRKQAESRRLALVELSDRIRDIRDPDDLAYAAAKIVGRTLGVTRAGYGAVDALAETVTITRDWNVPGNVSVAGGVSFCEFGSYIDALKRGETVAVSDVRDDPRTTAKAASFAAVNASSFLNVPVIEQGEFVALAFVDNAKPRAWTDEDAALMRELAERTRTAMERLRAEQELRESEAKQAFLLELSDVLRPLTDPITILGETNRMLAQRLGANRAYYVDVDEASGTARIEHDYVRAGSPSLAGNHRLDDFGWSADILRRGECHVIADTQVSSLVPPKDRPAAAALEIIASIAVPLVKHGRLIGALCVTESEPREWGANELDLVREIADRLWSSVHRARAERGLHELNETLEAQVAARSAERDRLWNLSQDMLARADYGGAISAVSPAWTRVLGWSEGELLARGYASFMHPDDAPTTMAAIGRMAENGEPARFENRIATRSGRWKPIEWTVAPEPDGLNFIAVGRDLSSAKEREAELEAAQELLRQSQKMEAMGSLTGGVAHDFNNLLTPIVGSLDLLHRRGLGDQREQRLIDGALQSAERARVLVQRLLAFARRQPLQSRPIDVGALVTGMADLVSSTTGPQIKVVVDVSNDLPAAVADPNQVEMAILNLSVNARDAMAEGGTLRISAVGETVDTGHRSRLRPGGYVRLSVADTGIGMDEATLDKAIEPFFSTKGVGQGTGLGLSMVHGLASQLGGALTIESRPGLGTNVEIWLPATDEIAPHPELAHESESRATVGTALLVDDQELVRVSTADMLTELGYAVVEASSAEEALELVDSGRHFDLLVTDHLMPGMTGTELTRVLSSRRPGVRALIVSGYADVDGIAPDLPRLAKPFRKVDLAAKLNEMDELSAV